MTDCALVAVRRKISRCWDAIWLREDDVEATNPCPCCGRKTMLASGDYDLCPVCFWEDDPNQLRWPDLDGGPNGPSLIAAQQTYLRSGAFHEHFVAKVRPARPEELVEPGWRPIDLGMDLFEPKGVQLGSWEEFETGPYWWRENFWRRG